MPRSSEWARRVWYFLNRRRLERELEREMASHRAQLEDPRRFGSALRIREQSADVWGWTWIDDLLHDLRYGARQLRRAPAFAAIAILTLTLGIGANTAYFSVINGDFFADAPVRDPGSLRSLEWADPPLVRRSRAVPYDAFRALTQAQSFASVACATDAELTTIGVGTNTFGGPVQRVTGNYFQTLGITMAQGRSLTAADDRPGAAPAAVISDGMWRRRLDSAPDVIGREITVGGAPVTIVGVTPPGFYARPLWRGVAVTLAMPPPGDRDDDSRCHSIFRLRAGNSDERAQAEAAILIRQFVVDPPMPSSRFPTRFTVRINRFGRGIDDIDVRSFLEREGAVIAASSFLLATMLLIPCANIAGIMLARAVTRRREISTRLALGAGRNRIVRQLLTEGLLLSSIAGVLGVAVSHILFRMLDDSGSGGPAVVDIRVLLYTAGVCVATATGFALVPALRATRIDLAATLRDIAGGFGRSRYSAGKVLTAVQVLLASVLLIGTAVQVRALVGALAPRGVEPERVTMLSVDLGNRDSAVTDVRRAIDQLGGLAGVEVASAVNGGGMNVGTCEPGAPQEREPEQPGRLHFVAPGFLRSTRIPLTRGRDLRWDDDGTAVISQSLATLLSGDRDPIGTTIRLYPHCDTSLTVVGVVADSSNAIGIDFDGMGTRPTAYVPLSAGLGKFPLRFVTLFVRAQAAPLPTAMLVRAVGETDAAARIDQVETQAQRLERQRQGLRTASSLLAGVSLLALFQAAFGLYAVLAHFVSRRTAEIGVRAVLGATPIDLVRLVVGQSLVPVGVGLGIAVALTPVAVSVMAQARITQPLDAGEQIVLLIPVLALLLTAFAAACGPALRATRIAPSVAVRAD
jgi:predicted permease